MLAAHCRFDGAPDVVGAAAATKELKRLTDKKRAGESISPQATEALATWCHLLNATQRGEVAKLAQDALEAASGDVVIAGTQFGNQIKRGLDFGATTKSKNAKLDLRTALSEELLSQLNADMD